VIARPVARNATATLHLVRQIKLNALAILMRRLRVTGSIGRGSKLKRRRGFEGACALGALGVSVMVLPFLGGWQCFFGEIGASARKTEASHLKPIMTSVARSRDIFDPTKTYTVARIIDGPRRRRAP
jgi:hypothetical protein